MYGLFSGAPPLSLFDMLLDVGGVLELDVPLVVCRLRWFQGSSGSEIWFRDFRSLSRKGSGVPPDRVGLLGAFLSGFPGNGPDLVRVLVSILFYHVYLVSITGKKIPVRSPCMARPQPQALSESSPCSAFPCTGYYSSKARNLSLYIPLTVPS
jgi:hypothetical protein